MYSTGKITTTANNTKVIGTNTKWKDNNSLVSPEQVILIQNGATIYINSIASIQSNTEMTLSFPVPAAVKDAAYNILTTMVHSVSDAANKIVAMNNANVQFSDILNRWATETGTITVTLPDGTTQQLRTTKEMDKQLDGKLDKAGGVITGDVTFDKNAIKSTKGTHALPEKSGSLMQVGDFGVGTKGAPPFLGTVEDFSNREIGVYIASDSATSGLKALLPSGIFHGSVILTRYNAGNTNCTALLMKNYGSDWLHMIRKGTADLPLESCVVWHSKNTTKDANGNLKAASPIVKVFADHIESNEESEGVELKKLHTGIYQLKNVLGMHSDASWGGVNGGITIPSGINQLPLVYADYDVLVAGEQHPFNGEPVTADEHGDIVIYTSYRKHFDLPQNVQYARLKTYPEFTKVVGDEQVELENGEPVDIPCGHWIDVRVNMPSNSIYNQKQVEAEAHAKEQAERVAREEAEKSELEAAEREQYGLSDNDIL